MHEIIEMFTRGNASTPFFRQSSVANKAANDAYSAAEAAADGYRGRTDAETIDGLTYIVTTLWRDKDAADAFAAKAVVLFAAFLAQRKAYYHRNRLHDTLFAADVTH